MQDSPFNNDSLGGYRNPLEADTANVFDNYNPVLDQNFYNTALNGAQPQTFGANNTAAAVPTPPPPPPSNQLVRRDANQQLATRTPQRNQWNSFNNSSNINNSTSNDDQRLSSESRVWENMEEDEEQDIDTKAAIAKKDAQAKRKQIPPFVQKLSRYVLA